jgi:hypothetical protein
MGEKADAWQALCELDQTAQILARFLAPRKEPL